MARSFAGGAGKTDGKGGDGDEAASWEGVNGVEQNVGQRFAQLALVAVKIGDGLVQFGLNLHDDALALGNVLPARAGHFDGLIDEAIDVNQAQLFIGFAPPIELAHAADGLGNILARGANVLQVLTGALLQIELLAHDHFGEGENG